MKQWYLLFVLPCSYDMCWPFPTYTIDALASIDVVVCQHSPIWCVCTIPMLNTIHVNKQNKILQIHYYCQCFRKMNTKFWNFTLWLIKNIGNHWQRLFPNGNVCPLIKVFKHNMFFITVEPYTLPVETLSLGAKINILRFPQPVITDKACWRLPTIIHNNKAPCTDDTLHII